MVRHFGHWKACALFWLTECIIDKVQSSAQDTTTHASSRPTTNDDNTSIYQKGDRRVFTCAVCRTKDSETWRKAPRNLSTNSMCDDCGDTFRIPKIVVLKREHKHEPDGLSSHEVAAFWYPKDEAEEKAGVRRPAVEPRLAKLDLHHKLILHLPPLRDLANASTPTFTITLHWSPLVL